MKWSDPDFNEIIWPADIAGKNGTIFCCGPIHVTGDWTIESLGAVVISASVLFIFSIFFYQNRNAGPKVWRSPWMPIFYGYLTMQFVAIPLFMYFATFAKGPSEPLKDWKRTIGVILSATDLLCGYFIVGQYLIISPLVDMKIFSWDGWFKLANYLLTFVMACIYYYEELTTDAWKNKRFQDLINVTETMVYLGNLLVLIECVCKGWTFSRAGMNLAITTGLNVFALYLRFDRPTWISSGQLHCL